MQPNRDGEIEMITQQVLKGCQWIIFSFSRGLLDSVTSNNIQYCLQAEV